jgi:RHS repeat-associated protein
VVLAAIAFNPVGENTSSMPAPAPQAGEVVTRVINYSYDPLYRLTAADYDDGTFFHYIYDAVGNRITQETLAGTNNYVYDIANRLIEVDGVSYTWDANGNMLSDGTSNYSYNYANQLVGVSQGGDAYTFAYNGIGDRLQQVVNGDPTTYTLDLNTGLTQVLADGANTYLYGNGRIGEEQAGGWQYYMDDALGSVRQMTNLNSFVIYDQSYEPYGSVIASAGSKASNYGYTGEWTDGTGLVHLRARFYSPSMGRFLTKDTLEVQSSIPLSYNKWLFAGSNPVNLIDPSGLAPCSPDHRYCLIIGGLYKGAFIDVHHYYKSRDLAVDILERNLPRVIGKPFASFTITNILQERIPYTRRYMTNIPLDIGGGEIERIGLGIFLDFQTGLEGFEGLVPWCWTPFFNDRLCSAFSNEDLPSDYLGFIVYVKHPEWNISDVAISLGGGEASDKFPTEYMGTWGAAARCLLAGDCGEDNPFNRQCTFKILDVMSGTYENRPWPSDLTISPIGPGRYWGRSLLDFGDPGSIDFTTH